MFTFPSQLALGPQLRFLRLLLQVSCPIHLTFMWVLKIQTPVSTHACLESTLSPSSSHQSLWKICIYIYMCVCIICAYSCLYTHAHMYACICMLVKARHSCYVSYLISLPLIFWDRVFAIPGTHQCGKTGQPLRSRDPAVFPSIPETDIVRNAQFSSGDTNPRPQSHIVGILQLNHCLSPT